LVGAGSLAWLAADVIGRQRIAARQILAAFLLPAATLQALLALFLFLFFFLASESAIALSPASDAMLPPAIRPNRRRVHASNRDASMSDLPTIVQTVIHQCEPGSIISSGHPVHRSRAGFCRCAMPRAS
jgi:hypothetical protein